MSVAIETLLKFIDLDIDDKCQEIRSKIDTSDIVQGYFSDFTWRLYDPLTQGDRLLTFARLKNSRYKLVPDTTLTFELSLKLFFGQVIDVFAPVTLLNKFTAITSFLVTTQGLQEYYLDATAGDYLEDYFSSLNENTISDHIGHCLHYLEYLNNFLDIDSNIINVYISKIYMLSSKYPSKHTEYRTLPGSPDVIIFSHLLIDFFETCTNESQKLLYMPILIWWKISTVIPMRPSEIATTLPQNCIEKENDKFYLKVCRIKSGRKKKNAKQNSLPILDRLEITEELANLISKYIADTQPFGTSKSLLSYKACRAMLESESYNELLCQKRVPEYMGLRYFSRLLHSFYKHIIYGKYEIPVTIVELSPGDTRHFAFFSLLLQGLSPIEIAMLGGHSCIQSQEHYQQGVKYYVDSQLYDLLYKRLKHKDLISSDTIRTIREIFDTMTHKTAEEISTFRRLRIGWCTCMFQDADDVCEDLDCCYFCSKFWIEKTESNYKLLYNDVKEFVLTKSQNNLKSDLNFLNQLLSNTTLKHTSDGPVLDRRNWTQLRTIANKVKSDCEEVAKLQYSIVNHDLLHGHIENLVDYFIAIDNSKEDN